MKIVLTTTTVNVPEVLRLYRALARAHAPHVDIVVAGDRRTPKDCVELCHGIGARYLSPDEQHDTWPELSAAVGFNCIQRRNFATLQALKQGAEAVVFMDDDNIPLGPYFDDVIRVLGRRHNGVSATGLNGWFDPGRLLVPPTRHRGFPHDESAVLWRADSCAHASVGVAAGLCLGDPDIDATTRIATAPTIAGVSELGRAGVAVTPGTCTVFNSQNTTVIRELIPAMAMLPGLGRHDDIFASLVTQRVMRDRGLSVHFGKPLVWQQRNAHNLVNDLKAELLGMEHVEEFARAVMAYPLPSDPLPSFLRAFYETAADWDWWPPQATKAALCWAEACERVMG